MTSSDPPGKVLLIDGDGSARAELAGRLRRESLRVREAAAVEDAVRAAAEERFALVLVGGPGHALRDYLEHIAPAPAASAPIVLVIASGGEPPLREGDEHRVHGVVHRPCDLDELARLVRLCADLKASSFGTMCFATMLAGAPLIALLSAAKY